MERNIIATTPEFTSPKELLNQLKSMAILDIIMNSKKEAYLRQVRKNLSVGEAYCFRNGAGDEMDIFFQENGVFIRGFDHEDDLNQFSADEWDESFFAETYAGVPENFLRVYEKEQKETMTFCMWYDYAMSCWKQNITEEDDGGKDFLLDCICKNAEEWMEWAKYYYRAEINPKILEKVYGGGKLTAEDITRMNPQRDAEEALDEIRVSGLEEAGEKIG